MSIKGLSNKDVSPRIDTIEDDITPTDINKTLQYRQLNTVNRIVDGECQNYPLNVTNSELSKYGYFVSQILAKDWHLPLL